MRSARLDRCKLTALARRCSAVLPPPHSEPLRPGRAAETESAARLHQHHSVEADRFIKVAYLHDDHLPRQKPRQKPPGRELSPSRLHSAAGADRLGPDIAVTYGVTA